MANDINKIISANPIKNGTTLVYCTKTGQTNVLNNSVKNTPTINDIQSKYDERFDDPAYYYGIGGGDVLGGNGDVLGV